MNPGISSLFWWLISEVYLKALQHRIFVFLLTYTKKRNSLVFILFWWTKTNIYIDINQQTMQLKRIYIKVFSFSVKISFHLCFLISRVKKKICFWGRSNYSIFFIQRYHVTKGDTWRSRRVSFVPKPYTKRMDFSNFFPCD